MIGKLTGIVAHRGVDHVMIEVGGVGYIVFCSDRTLAGIPSVGEAAALFTDLLVREDLLQLYGFSTLLEKEWHKLLMGVQGIGAKASMSILSTLGAEGIARAVTLGDWNAIKAAKGVGPKTAQKVVLDLKDKAPAIMAVGASLGQAAQEEGAEVIESTRPLRGVVQAEAMSALVNLGYAQGDAASAVAQAAHDAGPEAENTTPTLIIAALKQLAPKD